MSAPSDRTLGVDSAPDSAAPDTSRTGITRLRDKASDDRAALDALLDTTLVGHFGLIAADGHPMVIPTAIVRDGDTVLAHGSTGSPWMRRLASGASACLAVTALDGLVVARSAFESSLHYRSAVLFGTCAVLGDHAAKERALDLITERLLPGRTAEIRRPSRQELAATHVLGFPIREWSMKVSSGWPDDTAEDIHGDAWAGVVAQFTRYGAPIVAPDLRAGISIPSSVLALSDGSAQPHPGASP